MSSAFDFNLEFDKEFDISDEEIGSFLVSDGSGNQKFEETVLIYNENFGRDLDVTTEWQEIKDTGSETRAVSNGILTLNAPAGVGARNIYEKNLGFVIDPTNKLKKYRVKFRMKNLSAAADTPTYIGFTAANYFIIFQKDSGTNWNGYIQDTSTNEYFTANFAVTNNVYHEWEIIFNYIKADFILDGVNKGSLAMQPLSTTLNFTIQIVENEKLDFDWIRVWEINLPK